MTTTMTESPAAGPDAADAAGAEEVFLFPVSFAQQRLWLLHQMEPDSSTYNVQTGLRLAGALDVEALGRAVGEIVRRHEALRTTFAVVDGEPVQVIRSGADFRVQVADLAPGGDPEAELQRRMREDERRPFDLREGPLFRASLLRVAAEEHVLLLCMHHVVSDGWSTGVLLRELSVLYAAFSRGEASPLPELPVQYADFAVWQREQLQGAELEAQLAYWRGALAGTPALLELPTDRPRPAVQTYRGAAEGVRLSGELTEALRALAAGEEVTLFMTLLAGWQALLSKYSGQDDVVVGSSIAGRTSPEVEGLIGFFVNTLALRGDLSGDPTFAELLGRVRETTLGAYAHQELPFEKLVEELQPGRSLAHNPLFQAFLALQNTPEGSLRMEGLQVSRVGVGKGSAKFDVSLLLGERGGGVGGVIEYATDLFEAATIVRLGEHLRALLEGAAADPGRRLSGLSLLDAAERRRVLEEWNPPARGFASAGTLHEHFARQAALHPERTALVAEGERLGYAELNARANRLARYLRRRGVGPETRVGLCLERGVEMLVGILGVLKAGGAYVPLDPSYPAERLAYMAGDAGLALVLTHSALAERLPADGAPMVLLDGVAREVAAESAEDPAGGIGEQGLAYVIYTSGSTGRPKGAMLTHGSVLRLFSATREWFDFAPEDVWTLFHSYAFDFSVWEIWGALLHGGSLVVVPYLTSRSPERFRRLLREEGVTVLSQTPSAFQQLVEADAREAEPLERLRVVVFGGEALRYEGLRPWLDRYGPGRPRLVNMYGITETCVHVTYHAVTGRELRRASPGSGIGRAIPDLRLYVLDGAGGPVPAGVPGELYVGGAGLARGYLGRPELTAGRFVPDPFGGAAGERLYRSGDRVRWTAAGELEYLGRIDSQVKVRGFRIELGEVEAALLESGRVRECVVLAREDAPGDKRLVAYVVGQEGEAPGTRELREAARARLPEYMVPEAFVVLDALPLTGNGKTDRRALPAPESAGRDGAEEAAGEAPRTPVEEVLAGIWEEVLGIEGVGVEEDFFELGGHSLRATQVVSRVREALGVDVPLRVLFESPTVAGLAAAAERLLRDGAGMAVPPLRPAERERTDTFPLSFAQQRLWFLDRMQPGSSWYNIPAALRLAGALDAGALERALAETVLRHDALRTVFADHGEGPVQVVRPAGAAAFHLRVSEPPPDEAWERVADEAWAPFDLAEGPLFRAHLFRLGVEDHVLVVTVHHVVFDGWSGGVLWRELSVLYGAFARGEASPLAPLPVQYGDYAVWQREWLSGEVLEGQLAWWKERLAGTPVLELPTDRPRPAVQGHRGATHRFQVAAEPAQALRALARREGATSFMVVLAAWQALLARWSGQDDVAVGTPIAGRTRRETEELIGFFANTLALRTDLAGDPTARELVRRVREVTLGAYTHQDLPFEKLVEELRVERDLSRSPLVQVMFILRPAGGGGPGLPGVQASPVRLSGDTAKLDLLLAIQETAAGMAATLEYDRDLFDAATAARMGEHFRALLEGIAADPDRGLAEVDVLGADERRQLLEGWNATAAAYRRDPCIHTLCEEQAARAPERTALVHEGGRLTYAELDARANRLARHLRGRGVGPEVRVGVLLERGPEMVVALLGILKAGGAYVPLDPEYPGERLAWMLRDSGVPVLLTQARLRERVPPPEAAVVCLDEGWPEIALEDAGSPGVAVPPDALAYVIYTSGSTGRPKGVMNGHRGVVNRLLWMQEHFGLGPGDRVLQKTPFGFDVSVWEFFWPLLAGATLVVARPGGHRDAAYLAGVIEAEGVGVAHFVPSMLQLFLEEPGVERCRALRRVVCSGEALPHALQERFFERLPGVELHNLYGPTEAAVDVTSWRCRTEEGVHTVPIGRPVANTRTYVLDGRGHPVPAGVAGELYLGGVQVARGYLGRPELTAERFVPDPFGEPGARLYRTGDRVRRRTDGVLEYLGRFDFQVKVRGFRVEPGEIEAALLAHPGVREATVVAREDVPGEPRLVGYLVAAADAPDPAGLRAWLRERLPEPMVPSALVALEALPLSPNGKLDRAALPAPEPARPAAGVLLLPDSALEETIAAAWREVLRLESVGVEDNFFDLGGHSLLLARVHRALAGPLPGLSIVDLFQYPTVRALARLVEHGGGGSAPVDGARAAGEARRDLRERQQRQMQQRRQAANRQQEMDA